MSTVGTIICLPLLGYAGDKVPSPIIVPFAFFLRGMSGYAFLWINNPKSGVAQLFCCCLIIFSVVESVSIEVLLMRGMPNKIRGTMMGLFNFFGVMGSLSFTLIGGQIFDRIDRCAPFIYLALMDTVLVLTCLTLTALGKFVTK